VSSKSQEVEALLAQKYRHGFITDIESDSLPPGLDEGVVAAISKKKHEPQFLLDWRLKAFRHWQTMQEPTWAHVHYKPIDYQDISYYSAPRAPANAPKSIDEVDPKLLATYAKLGIPLHERARLAGVAVDAVFDSVSVATTFQTTLRKAGVIFCPISEAVRDHPDLVKQYLGTVVPTGDNFFAALNAAAPEELLVRLKEHADRELAPYRSRMGATQIRQVKQQFEQKQLLVHYNLPRLSLFYMSQQ